MPQLNSDDAANDEPTAYNVEGGEDEQEWNENLHDIKHDLVEELDKDRRGGSSSKGNSHGEASNKDRIERDDPRDEAKGPGRPYLYPPDIGSIVSSLPSFFQNGGLPPNSKVPYPYNPYSHLLYGPGGDIDSKTGVSRPHHPDIPAMYSLPGQLGQIPHPLAPWSPHPSIYPMCTASTICNSMFRYPNPFAAFTSAAAAAASNMPRLPHGPGMHPTMIPHPALVSNGPLGNMGNGQHPHHGKHDDKPGGRHSKGDSEPSRSKRDRPYVKKPLNAFMLYMKEQRAKVVAECTLKESAAINQILGRKWHSLSREEQQKYYEMARKERQLHLQMYPGWSARDNYGKRKKRKKEKSQGECTAQNPKKCRAVFGLEQQHNWCAPCRRKKKCIRYQHDDDSDEDDLSPMNSPHQYSGYPNQSHPFDSMRTSPPLSITSQSLSSTNSDFNASTATSSSSRPPNHVSPAHPHAVIQEGGATPDIKQEYRTSPSGIDAQMGMANGRAYEQFNGRHPGRTSSSENSFKSEGSPHSQGGESNNSHGNHHHGNNENNNNSGSKEHPHHRQNFNNGVSNNGQSNHNPQSTIHRQASAPPSGSENRSSFRKANSLDSSDVPGPSGLTARRNSDMPHHNMSGHSSENSPGSRTNRNSGSFSKPNAPSSSHVPHPSPLHPQSAGLYLPNQTGNSPLLPVSPPYNHSPHGGPFMHPISPYLPAALAAFGAPTSPLGGPMLSLFKGISPSSIGGGMGGPNPGSSHAGHSRGTPSAVVEGKS